jgi:cytochrome c biogenesis protein CcmG, thiol:disulfide interchange protein DsbE
MSTSKTKAARKEQAKRRDTRRNWTVAIIVGVVVVLAAVAAVLATRGGDDGDQRLTTAPVEVTGEPLPRLAEGADDALGMPAPGVGGQDFDGEPVSITPGEQPQVLLFVAHWCPVCQDEVRSIQEWIDAGDMPDGFDLVSVSTGVDRSRPNYPPDEWLEQEGWTVPVIADDDQGSAAAAYGLPAYPFFVFVDGDGAVVGRHAGAIPMEQFGQIVEQLAAP